MSESPLISILTPLYNKKNYIAQCIQSVLDQNCDQVEHVIQDGGSTDGSMDIVREYAQKHNHLKIYSEPDSGQSQAMNRAIQKANGGVIGFLNADDYYEPGIFERVIECFNSLKYDSLLIGNCNIWRSEAGLLCVNKPESFTLLDLIRDKKYPWNSSAYFYHKSLHDKIGLYDEGEDYIMDLDFFARVYPHANVKYIDEVFGNFRLMPGCKTFEDSETGQMHDRIDNYLMKYYKELAFWQKSMVLKTRILDRISHLARRIKGRVKAI